MAQIQMMPRLSGNDAQVLNALFDAESALSKGPQIQETIPALPRVEDHLIPGLEAEEKDIVRPLAASETPFPETIATAIKGLDALIRRAPQYAQAYVNRAQAQRMLLGDRPLTADERPAVSSIVSDLSAAIDAAAPAAPDDPVSALQVKVLSSAYTHRAHLYYHIAKSGDLSSLPGDLSSVGPASLEELASRDFMMGGKYGNEIARQMSVRTNPYAKLCGAIVREALQTEIEASAGYPAGRSGLLSDTGLD